HNLDEIVLEEVVETTLLAFVTNLPNFTCLALCGVDIYIADIFDKFPTCHIYWLMQSSSVTLPVGVVVVPSWYVIVRSGPLLLIKKISYVPYPPTIILGDPGCQLYLGVNRTRAESVIGHLKPGFQNEIQIHLPMNENFTIGHSGFECVHFSVYIYVPQGQPEPPPSELPERVCLSFKAAGCDPYAYSNVDLCNLRYGETLIALMFIRRANLAIKSLAVGFSYGPGDFNLNITYSGRFLEQHFIFGEGFEKTKARWTRPNRSREFDSVNTAFTNLEDKPLFFHKMEDLVSNWNKSVFLFFGLEQESKVITGFQNGGLLQEGLEGRIGRALSVARPAIKISTDFEGVSPVVFVQAEFERFILDSFDPVADGDRYGMKCAESGTNKQFKCLMKSWIEKYMRYWEMVLVGRERCWCTRDKKEGVEMCE
ncbi:hypothetical protein HID58_033802, partial [Brassica napus]